MSHPYRRTYRRTRIRWFRVGCLLALVAAGAVALDSRSQGSSLLKAPLPSITTTASPSPRTSHHRRPLGKADGAVPAGTTVFDDAVPGVANLDPDLLGALRRAATDAARGGVQFVVDSGWRSAAYQKHLLQEAVATYGSKAEAARWVATPGTSAHVSGDAVDIGPATAATWLSAHGVAYGLCQIYANEPWHYELRPAAAGQGCPAMYADPTHDPRMQ
ncbi:MAG TPA: M15 family metallopeptidase [Solirubrobacter sp.]|nr:M15 family metallopeptidase [Solirubrobacter sp.]